MTAFACWMSQQPWPVCTTYHFRHCAVLPDWVGAGGAGYVVVADVEVLDVVLDVEGGLVVLLVVDAIRVVV